MSVGTEEADGPNSHPVNPAPVAVAVLQHARESPQVIRLVQAFGRLDRDRVWTGITFLDLFLRTSARGIARQLAVDPAQITIGVDAPQLRRIHDLRTAGSGSADPTSDDFVD